MSEAADESVELFSSRYNFSIPTAQGGLLYNAMSGAVLLLAGRDGADLARQLGESICRIEIDLLPSELLGQLQTGGFLVPPHTDEIKEIKRRYWQARRDTPMVVTITTTQDCNLGCYYCYGVAIATEKFPTMLRKVLKPYVFSS